MTQPILLPYRIISINGPDAEKFLQGQTSCDIAKLTESQFSFGTVNTPKGRMYGLFVILRTTEGFLLRAHNSIIDTILTQLGKYKVFFKCEMRAEDAMYIYGCLDKPDLLKPELETFSCASREDNYILRLPGKQACYEQWCSDAPATSDETEQERWSCVQCENGIPELYAETQEQFILQYLNLQNLNAVSFNKGCYTGQEIIARMKFLGKLKKKTFLLRTDQQKTGQPGQALFDEQGKKCGELVRSHWHQEHGSVALGILDLSYSETPSPVYLEENTQTPFSVEELSYS